MAQGFYMGTQAMKANSGRLIQLSLSFLLLLSGGCIYVSFRSKSLLLFRWLDELGLCDAVESMRNISAGMMTNSFLLYNLPDGLWMTSYLLIVNAIVPKSNKKVFLMWTMLLPILGVAHEVLQALHLLQGIFDFIDVLCYLVPLLIFFIYLKCFGYEKENV